VARDSTREVPDVGELLAFLIGSSAQGIRAVELARLGEANALEKEMQRLLSRLVAVHAEAALCRLMLELRSGPRPGKTLPARKLLRR
jgi:hypothetical protein